MQLHSSRVARRAAGPEDKEPEQPDKPEEQVSGTLSNRYSKMVEELQKAGLTPAKAKVRSHRGGGTCQQGRCATLAAAAQ